VPRRLDSIRTALYLAAAIFDKSKREDGTFAPSRLPVTPGCTKSSMTVRVIARKNGHRVKLYSRPGNDLTPRFPLIVEALARLRSRSCIIDGEAVACGDDGVANFELIRRWDSDHSVFMWAYFDLIELDGTDMRRDPLATRKAKLADLLGRLRLDCGLTSTWTRKMAPSSSIMLASSAWRGSCRSAAIRRIAPVGRDIGSRARTRTRPR